VNSLKPTILDTDIASGIGGDVDDALALLLALSLNELDLKAVTIVYGRVDVKAQLALNLLALTNRRDVTVAMGASQPLTPGVFRKGGQEGFMVEHVEALDPRLKTSSVHAIDVIGGLAREYGEVNLITIGPLTNLALAILRYPDLIDHVEKIYVMGGAFRQYLDDGLRVPVTEYNVRADPIAAKIVFESGIPITLVPLDVTLQTRLYAKDIDKLETDKKDVLNYVRSLISGREFWYMHDPLTVGVAVNKGFVETMNMCVTVEVKGEHTMGETVAVNGKPNAEVCVKIKPREFIEFYLSTVFG